MVGAPGLALTACSRERDADVIVIGAGLAGLQAAITLQDGGADVLVIEGSNRVGGRVFTLDDLPGRPEAGGTEIGANYARMRDMIARLGGLPLQRWLDTVDPGFALRVADQTLSMAEWADSPLNPFTGAEREAGGPMGPFGVYATYLPRPNPLAELDSWLDPAVAALDIRYDEYLRARGASDAALRFAAPSVQADRLSQVSALWQLRSGRFGQAGGGLDGLERVTTGAGRVPEGMAGLLKREVRFGHRVNAIRSEDNGISISTSDGKRLSAAFAVVSVPLTVLRTLRIEPGLPRLQADAVMSIPYGHAVSIFFAVKEPFWEQDALPAATWSDGPFGRVFSFNTEAGRYLWMYKTGRASQTLRDLRDTEIMARAEAELHAARPASVGRVMPTAVVNWSASPWTRGHNAYRGPGDIRRFGNVAATPHGRLHFAGEHTATLMMGMEGAMESGERAALEVLQRF